MTMPMPPQLEAAVTHLSSAIEKIEGKPVDLVKTPWPELEKSIIKVLGGPFDVRRQEHQIVALGLSGAFSQRLGADHGAFWFPYREAPEQGAVGFPEALIMLSPFGAVVEALRSAKLAALDDVQKDLRNTLAQVKFSGGAAQRLSPEDYMRLFDPAFAQFIAIDGAKVKQTWALAPERVASDLRDAINRAPRLTPEVKKQMEQQLVTALTRLEPGKPLLSQAARAPRVLEMMSVLFGAVQNTGAAAEEFWAEVVMPLLHIGAPATFPPLDDQEVEVAKQGVDPLFLFVDLVPYQFKAAEEGLVGAFDGDSLSLPDPAFEGAAQVRLIKLNPAGIKPALEAFDAAKTRDAIARFGVEVARKVGPTPAPQGAEEAKMMLDAALAVLGELKALVATGKDVYFRRLTEAEASSEPALTLVRQALSAPRIILST